VVIVVAATSSQADPIYSAFEGSGFFYDGASDNEDGPISGRLKWDIEFFGAVATSPPPANTAPTLSIASPTGGTFAARVSILFSGSSGFPRPASSRALHITASTSSSEIVRGARTRGSSYRPASRPSMNRRRQLPPWHSWSKPSPRSPSCRRRTRARVAHGTRANGSRAPASSIASAHGVRHQ
jgi:hypothetical protein